MSDVYRTTRLAFLVKMLNHDVPQFRNMARESLRLDMVKRGVPLSENSNNFLGYDLNTPIQYPRPLFRAEAWVEFLGEKSHSRFLFTL